MWKKIEEKYPKALEVFGKWFSSYKDKTNWDALFNAGTDMVLTALGYDYRTNIMGAPKINDLPFEMQLGVIMRFFDEAGIGIAIYMYPIGRCGLLYSEHHHPTVWETLILPTRTEAEQAAFEKAFEILEEKL